MGAVEALRRPSPCSGALLRVRAPGARRARTPETKRACRQGAEVHDPSPGLHRYTTQGSDKLSHRGSQCLGLTGVPPGIGKLARLQVGYAQAVMYLRRGNVTTVLCVLSHSGEERL